MLLPETDYQPAELVLQRIQQKLAQVAQDNSFDVGFSMGAITFLEPPDSVDRMIEQVDGLMYQVKNSVKNALKHQLI